MTKNIHRRRDADPEEGIEKYGDATFADSTTNKYPIDTPGRIKAAWAGFQGVCELRVRMRVNDDRRARARPMRGRTLR
jgi:hypothetical protein